MAKKRKKTPSRIKYEKEHPVLSCRSTKEIRDRLQEVKETLGMSNADVFKVGLGILEPKVRQEKEIRQQAYEKGQVNGYELAESDFKITYPCSRCKKMIEVTTEGEKKAIRKFMVQSGWCHGDCNNP